MAMRSIKVCVCGFTIFSGIRALLLAPTFPKAILTPSDPSHCDHTQVLRCDLLDGSCGDILKMDFALSFVRCIAVKLVFLKQMSSFETSLMVKLNC
nr:hypothetical protein [Tanacetum cinerariifolium]